MVHTRALGHDRPSVTWPTSLVSGGAEIVAIVA
jgi:hypothetical protein